MLKTQPCSLLFLWRCSFLDLLGLLSPLCLALLSFFSSITIPGPSGVGPLLLRGGMLHGLFVCSRLVTLFTPSSFSGCSLHTSRCCAPHTVGKPHLLAHDLAHSFVVHLRLFACFGFGVSWQSLQTLRCSEPWLTGCSILPVHSTDTQQQCSHHNVPTFRALPPPHGSA